MDRFRVRAKVRRLKKWANEFNEKLDKVEKAKLVARKLALKSPYGFIDALQAKGFERLGSGYFSEVVGHPDSDKVMKIIYRPQTDGWLDYVKWAADNGFAGKFAPQVYSYKLIKSNADPERAFGVAVMERLKKTITETDIESDVKAVGALFGPAILGNPLSKILLDTVQPGLVDFGKALKKEFPKNLDVHGANMMVRKDGSFVITDPVAQLDSKVAKLRLRRKDFSTPEKLAA